MIISIDLSPLGVVPPGRIHVARPPAWTEPPSPTSPATNRQRPTPGTDGPLLCNLPRLSAPRAPGPRPVDGNTNETLAVRLLDSRELFPYLSKYTIGSAVVKSHQAPAAKAAPAGRRSAGRPPAWTGTRPPRRRRATPGRRSPSGRFPTCRWLQCTNVTQRTNMGQLFYGALYMSAASSPTEKLPGFVRFVRFAHARRVNAGRLWTAVSPSPIPASGQMW